jgi:hypothetical protein
MSLARYFSKPRWQSRDEAIRRAAVAQDSDSALIESLPKLAREDTDAGVRLAAMRRLADPGLTQAMAADDRDDGVRVAAKTLWSELLAGTHTASPPLADRLRLLRAQDDPRLVEHIAIHAPESELRLAALQRIDRQALILERITGDSDAAVRLAALERVESEDHLVRIVERTRKSDKIINRLANERLENLRVARGDSGAIEGRARNLCERMERVLREGDSSDEATSIETAWAALAAQAPAVYVLRYRNARELFDLSRNPLEVARLRQRAQDRARIEQELGELEQLLAEAPSARELIDNLVQRYEALSTLHLAFADGADDSSAALSIRCTRLGAQLAGVQAQLSKEASTSAQDERLALERERDQARREARKAEDRMAREQARTQALADLQHAIDGTAQAIQSGRSGDAHARHAELMQIMRKVDNLPANLRSALADVEREYARITQWQQWSDNQRRGQLCEELDALPLSGLHPDALATRLREIQAEWTQLDRIEGRPAQANDGLARRFRALCRKAIEPAKPYFEKRDALRRQGSQEAEALLAEARAAGLADNPDWRHSGELRRRLGDALRNLDRVDPRERKALAAELKAALGTLDERIKARDQAIESVKSELIARADALSATSDTRTAIAQARELQKLWQTSGNGRRARDQTQWKLFRAALDAVFARADDERNARSVRDQEALAAATALCAQLEAIAGSDVEPDRAELKRIDVAWRDLASGDASLRRRYQSAHERLQSLTHRMRKKQQRAAYDVWLAHYDLLRHMENAQIEPEGFAGRRSELPPLTLCARAFEDRVGRDRSDAAPAADSDGFRDCVLEMEQLAGIEPPAEDRQRRMDMQVERLSARMRGEQALAPEAQLQSLLDTWLELGAAPADQAAREDRFRAALIAALDTLG